MLPGFKNRSVDVHQFSMVPRADIPRSAFVVEFAHKTTFDADYLIPIYQDEALPGDQFRVSVTAFARMSTPLFPVMDNLHMDWQFWFVPLRLIWSDSKKFFGEQRNPGDSISFSVPQIVSAAGGFPIKSLYDYMGLPTVGQVGGGNTVSVAAFWTRAYNLIYNEWYRDENLQNSVTVDTGAGPDAVGNYALLKRGKRHDYFTSALPWPQKGNTAVSLPLGTSANIINTVPAGANNAVIFRRASDGLALTSQSAAGTDPSGHFQMNSGGASVTGYFDPQGSLVADLSTATAATINQIRQAFQIQRLLERDARGGTRYVELVLSHFGVRSPDARQQRPEYLGGGSQPITVTPVAQTSGTGASGTSAPLATLSGVATSLSQGIGFQYSATEHGVLLGIVSIRADLTYQQGLRRMWSRLTRYDFYWPVFSHLGEQSVLSKEIYCDGGANDNDVFGYQERWAEYRHHPSMITGLFRSTSAGTIDPWHLAQKFASRPVLDTTFIQQATPMDRVLAVGSAALGQQFIFDSVWRKRLVRNMPLYSVPGMIDHF